jgi:hypothetical protein
MHVSVIERETERDYNSPPDHLVSLPPPFSFCVLFVLETVNPSLPIRRLASLIRLRRRRLYLCRLMAMTISIAAASTAFFPAPLTSCQLLAGLNFTASDGGDNYFSAATNPKTTCRRRNRILWRVASGIR